ncbi:MAG: hypothetical protein ACYTX0_56875, partial [Nostoc sp.]
FVRLRQTLLTSFFLCDGSCYNGGNPRNALPLLCVLLYETLRECGSFFFLVLKYGLAHLHTELV